MTPEQSRILVAKPLARMRRFAALLNWHGLQLSGFSVSPKEARDFNLPPDGIMVCYMTPDLKFNLQINEYPLGQSLTHQATIKADRYAITYIDWQPFTLGENDDVLRAEAERVRPVLDRRLWKNRKWRHDFVAANQIRTQRPHKKRRGHH